MEQFHKGDEVRVSIEDGEWIDGVVEIASGNGRSLAVSFDEGVPVPFGVKDARQLLLLLWEGRWCEIQGNRWLLIERAKKTP